MAVEKYDLENGREVSDDFNRLPDRAKELFFAFCLSDKHDNPTDITDFIITMGFEVNGNSPIEQIFSFAYSLVIWNHGFIEYDWANYPESQKEIATEGHKYRVDFCFHTPKADGTSLDLVIECDGHEFHKATKEQVARDNERDFNLKKAGYEVIHFSGSQLYKEPYECAERVFDYIRGKANGNL